MKEIAILFKVPVVVFKLDRTFDHYAIVDVAKVYTRENYKNFEDTNSSTSFFSAS